MVVLDDVDPAARERRAELRELGGRQALRLERGAGQRSVVHPKQRAQPRDAVARAAEPRGKRVREGRVDELDMWVERAVAKEHVHAFARRRHRP